MLQTNIIEGTTVLLLGLIGYALAFVFQKQNRYSPALLLLILCGLALRVYCATDFFLHPWDERYHALVAKHLVQHPLKPTLYEQPLFPYDYRNWTQNHIWLHKQPLSLWCIAICIKLFGVSSFVVRIPSIIFSTIAIKLTYDIADNYYGKKVAFGAAFLTSIHGLIIELTAGRTATDHPDIALYFFVLLGIWSAVKWVRKQNILWFILIGICAGAAVLSKWLSGLLIFPVGFLLCFPFLKQNPLRASIGVCVALFTAALMVLPWQLYITTNFPNEAQWEFQYNSMHLRSALEGHEGSFFYHFDKLRINYGEAIYLPVAWFTYTAFRRGKAHEYALLTWFWIPFLFFSVAATKMPAYTTIAAPAIFIITSLFAHMVFEKAGTVARGKIWLRIIGLSMFLLPIRYSVERIKPFDKKERASQSIADLKKLSHEKGKAVLLNYDAPIEAMFYTDLIAYSVLPDANAIVELQTKGFNVFINDDGNIPQTLRAVPGVTFVSLRNAPF